MKWSLIFYFPKTKRSFTCKLTLDDLLNFDKDFFSNFPLEVFDYYENKSDYQQLDKQEFKIQDYKTFVKELIKR